MMSYVQCTLPLWPWSGIGLRQQLAVPTHLIFRAWENVNERHVRDAVNLKATAAGPGTSGRAGGGNRGGAGGGEGVGATGRDDEQPVT